MSRKSIQFLGVLFVMLAATALASAQVRTRTVAASGTPAPGGGIFAPSIDETVQRGLLPSIAGKAIVFGSTIDLNGQDVYGVFLENNSVLRLVTRVGYPTPTGQTIQEIDHYTIDESGTVFVAVRTGAGDGPDTIVKYTNGALFTAVRVGDMLPDGGTVQSIGDTIASNARGGVYFHATYAGGTALVEWTGLFEPLVFVANTGMAAPSGGTFASISPTAIVSSTSGLVAFSATVDGGSSGIFTGLAGNLVLGSTATDALPNLALSDNDEVDVIFMRPNTQTIQRASIDGTSTVVSNTTSAPRTTGHMSFGNVMVALTADVEASVTFFAPVTGDEKVNTGLFKRDRFSGEITAIALNGDPAAGDVSGVFGRFALSSFHPTRIATEDGKVVFMSTAGFNGTETAIFTTLKAPEGVVPTVTKVQVKKGKLKVTGTRFEDGARILLSGNPLTDTKNSKKKPTTLLVSKTGGGQISVGETVSIIIQNPSGAQSAPFSFTRTQ